MAKLLPVFCPQCRKKYRLPKSFENRQVVCKRCQHQFLVQLGGGASTQSSDGDVASPFDSLDIDGLLNAPTSGLERSKLPAKGRSRKKRQKRSASNPPDSIQAKTVVRPTDKNQKLDRDKAVETVNQDLIEQELEFAWAKKKRDKEKAEAERNATAGPARAKSDASADTGGEFDQEELAIYQAVTRQNRRRNFFWGAIAAMLVISVGGFFAKQEYQLLGKPLSQAERDWLTERGFVLEARDVAKAKANGGDGATVMVAAGKSFADVDQFGLTPKIVEKEDNQDNQDNQGSVLGGRLSTRPGTKPNDGNAFGLRRRNRGAPNRRNKPARAPLPKVDFDTNVDATSLVTAPVRSAQQVAFSGYAVAAFSPLGHAYVAGSKFIKAVSADGDVFDQRSLRPSQTVTAIVATPDGRYVVLGDDQGIVQAYRVDAKGRLSPSWKLRHIHRDKIIQLRVSQDARRIVVYSADGRLTVWDLENQLIERNLSDLVPEERLSSFQLTNDAIVISSGESIRQIRFDQPAVDVVNLDKQYHLLAVDRSGQNIIGADGKQISALQLDSKRPKWGKTIRIDDRARVEFSPDGETAFYYDGGREVLHFEVDSGRLLQRYGDDRLKSARRVAVSFDGKRLLTCGDSDAALIYKIEDVNPVRVPKLKSPLAAPSRVYPPRVLAEGADVVAVASPDFTGENVSAACLNKSGFLIAAVQGRTIVYDWTTEEIAYERFDSQQDKVTTMTTVGDQLVLGRSSGLVEVGKIDSDGKLGSFIEVTGHIDRVKFIVPIPKTSLVASVTQSGHTRIWDLLDLKSNKTVYVGKPVDSPVQSVAVDRRSDLLLAAGDVLATLDYKSGNVKQKKGEVRVRKVTLLPDGKRLGFFDRGKLNLATTSRGEINLSIDLPKGAQSVSFSPTSKLAFVFADAKVIVYRLRGGKEIFNFPIGWRSNKETEMVFSTDKKFMMPFQRGGRANFQIYATPSP